VIEDCGGTGNSKAGKRGKVKKNGHRVSVFGRPTDGGRKLSWRLELHWGKIAGRREENSREQEGQIREGGEKWKRGKGTGESNQEEGFRSKIGEGLIVRKPGNRGTEEKRNSLLRMGVGKPDEGCQWS